MSKQTEIAASDWLAVRERVVEKLREASPQSQKDTRVRMAEALILAGYVDVEFIAAEIAEEKRVREQAEQARLARGGLKTSDSQKQEGKL